MTSPNFPHPQSTASIGGHPIHPMLVPFPIVCFTGALLTDIAYWQTSDLLWQHFSEWLLFAGLVIGVLAGIAGAVDLLARRSVRAQGPAWPHAIGNIIALLLAFWNSLIHSGDGWTAVVPWGIVLSAITVVIILITAWLGGSMVYRHGVGVSNYE